MLATHVVNCAVMRLLFATQHTDARSPRARHHEPATSGGFSVRLSARSRGPEQRSDGKVSLWPTTDPGQVFARLEARRILLAATPSRAPVPIDRKRKECGEKNDFDKATSVAEAPVAKKFTPITRKANQLSMCDLTVGATSGAFKVHEAVGKA